MVNYTFHWYQAFNALPEMLWGALVTIEVAVLSMVIGIVIGVLLALGRTSGDKSLPDSHCPGSRARATRPRCSRSTWPISGSARSASSSTSFPALLIGISFNNAGYLAETFRGGLRAIPATQMRAARSLGMSAPAAFRLVVLPQLFRTVFHPMMNQMVWAILMTSLGVIVGVNTDLAGVTQELNVRTFRTFEYFALARRSLLRHHQARRWRRRASRRAAVPVLSRRCSKVPISACRSSC